MNLLQFTEIARAAVPMTETDHDMFNGAPEGSLIAFSETAVYIISETEVSIITEDDCVRFELSELI